MCITTLFKEIQNLSQAAFVGTKNEDYWFLTTMCYHK